MSGSLWHGWGNRREDIKIVAIIGGKVFRLIMIAEQLSERYSRMAWNFLIRCAIRAGPNKMSG